MISNAYVYIILDYISCHGDDSPANTAGIPDHMEEQYVTTSPIWRLWNMKSHLTFLSGRGPKFGGLCIYDFTMSENGLGLKGTIYVF